MNRITFHLDIAPTGAEVDLLRFDFKLQQGVVLARWREEWVTWRVYPGKEEGDPMICEVGHYFRDAVYKGTDNAREAALQDFNIRI